MPANDNASPVLPRTSRANIAAELGTRLFVSVPALRDAIVGVAVGKVERGMVIVRGRSALCGLPLQRAVPVADLERA